MYTPGHGPNHNLFSPDSFNLAQRPEINFCSFRETAQNFNSASGGRARRQAAVPQRAQGWQSLPAGGAPWDSGQRCPAPHPHRSLLFFLFWWTETVNSLNVFIWSIFFNLWIILVALSCVFSSFSPIKKNTAHIPLRICQHKLQRLEFKDFHLIVLYLPLPYWYNHMFLRHIIVLGADEVM